MSNNLSCEAPNIVRYNKIFVINLDGSTERLNKVTQEFNAAGVEFERFSAINGYQVVITDLKNNNNFTGLDFKNKSAKMEKGVQYKITCNPGAEKLVEFNYTSGTRWGNTAGELGIWCSHKAIWHHIKDNNINIALVFEDDVYIKGNKKDFKNKLDNFITNLPETFDLAYIDARQIKGKRENIEGNHWVKKFTDNSLTYGLHGMVVTQQAAEKLLSSPCYQDAIDIFLWNIMSNDAQKRPTCLSEPISMEVYISAESLISTSGESIINLMGR